LEATLTRKSETGDLHLPKIDSKLNIPHNFLFKVRDDPITIDPAELNKPLKKILNE